MQHKTLVVVGGGAAGFFCAVNAARLAPALKVVLLEKTNKLLAKVKVSGGGRCNVTHACFDVEQMSRHYPRGERFVKKSFHHFFTTDTIEWFRERGVELKKENDGRMFPVTDNSQTIIDCLLNEASKYGVEVRVKETVHAIRFENEKWLLDVGDNKLSADYVCIACGGFAKKELFSWLEELGHHVELPVPSLFTFNMPGHPITKLMGVAVEEAIVRISKSKIETSGPLLITHWGLSGPAILKASAWAARILNERNYDFEAVVNFLPRSSQPELVASFNTYRNEMAAQKLSSRNKFDLPQRLWEYLLTEAGIKPETRWADLPSKNQQRLMQLMIAHPFHISGKTTFKEEFVTAGGIKLSEIDHHTMQSRVVPGLFFAGEIMDVDGVTGGFNFQHAWTSGFLAATAIAKLAAVT